MAPHPFYDNIRFALPDEPEVLLDAYEVAENTPTAPVPLRCDLSRYATPVKCQGRVGACTAFSVIAAIEMVQRISDPGIIVVPDYSELFLYWVSRVRVANQQPVVDRGVSINDAITAVERYGACPSPRWPYDERRYSETPSREAFDSAKKRKDGTFKVLYRTQIKNSLANERRPVIAAYDLYPNMRETIDGTIPLPRGEKHGGHAICIVGYDDSREGGMFKFKNSWGPAWGNNGYGWIRYNQIRDPWTIRHLALPPIRPVINRPSPPLGAWIFIATGIYTIKSTHGTYLTVNSESNPDLIQVPNSGSSPPTWNIYEENGAGYIRFTKGLHLQANANEVFQFGRSNVAAVSMTDKRLVRTSPSIRWSIIPCDSNLWRIQCNGNQEHKFLRGDPLTHRVHVMLSDNPRQWEEWSISRIA